MKQILFLIVLAGLTQFSCRKTDSPAPLSIEGKWRMVAVKDNATNTTTTKPAATIGDVDLTFTFSSPLIGTFAGITTTNDFNGDFTAGSLNMLSIPFFTSTKVAEPLWGDLFSNNFRHATDYILGNDGKLNINTATNLTLTFIRL